MTEEHVVTLILRDGTSTGIIECTLDEWYGISYKIPRNRLKDASKLKCINNTGVYVLFGEDENTGEKIAYIGEAEYIYSRLEQHNRNKDFWNECVVFMSENNSLNKAHIKYIERELYQTAKSVNRFKIKNDVKPTNTTVGSADEIKAKKFIKKIKTIISIMGYRIFDNLINESQVATDENILYLKSGGEVIARAVVTDEGFVILKGSKIKGDIRPAISESLLKYCKKERESSDIVDGIFIKDHLVSSPSMGAVVILGINTNGRTAWKNKDGVSLKELQENQK